MESDPARNEWLTADDKEFLSNCVFNEYQASGPGGQKRNRKYSGARLKHIPSGKEARDAGSRSQNDNKRAALRKLRAKIALEIRCDESPRVDSYDIALRNPRYPLLLAKIMDTLYKHEFRVSEAAADLGVSTGKLSKITVRDPRLFTAVNKEREFRGLSKLRS
ncbi:MAG: hypothetical protein GXP32_05220 [Kiritimatiellaeota bacterium]|nr:hypothetical protein [Kiritimatiellota bacterium]